VNEQTPENAPLDPAELMGRLFPRKRARLVVEVDLDPVPGWGHSVDDWQRHLQRHLNDAAGHYHPTVTVDSAIPPASKCRDCGADFVPVRRGECSRCGSDNTPIPPEVTR
jgi:hypothetical protein